MRAANSAIAAALLCAAGTLLACQGPPRSRPVAKSDQRSSSRIISTDRTFDLPRGTPEEQLPHFVSLPQTRLRFPDEDGSLRDPRQFVQPWQPSAFSSIYASWKLVVDEVRYDQDKMQGRWFAQHPKYTWREKKGVCLDTAALLASWLIANRYNALVGIGLYTGDNPGSHAWVVLRDSVERRTYLLETALDSPLEWRTIEYLPASTQYVLRAVFNDKAFYANVDYVSDFK